MDKSIRIQATVDSGSFDGAKRKLQELVGEMKKLADASKEIAGLGGIFTAGSKSAPLGTGKNKPSTAQLPIGGVDNITKSAAAFKTASNAARDALKDMTNSFREHVGLSTREGERLLGFVDRLKRSFADLSSASRKAFGQGGSYQGASSYAWGGFGQPAPIEAPQGLASRGMSAAGRFMGGPGLAIAGGLIAAGSLGIAGIQSARANENANLGYAIQRPFYSTSRLAQYGQMYGNSALAIRGGDISESMALRAASGSAQGKYILGGQYMADQRRQLENMRPTSLWESVKAGRGWEWLKGDVSRDANRWWNLGKKAFNGLGGHADIDPYAGGLAIGRGPEAGLSAMDIERRKAMETELPMTQAQAFAAEAAKQRMMDPVYNNRVNSIYGGAIGSLSTARALGISGDRRFRRTRNPLTGKIDLQAYDSLEDAYGQANKHGYDVGEIAGIRQQVGATAGRGLFYSGGLGLLSAQAGGFGNAVNMYGLGAQFGGGGAAGAGRFLGGLQGMIGRGGVDVTAGSQMFGVGQGLMTGGNFTGFDSGAGLGLMQTLADATMTGSAGGDMLRARQVQGGIGLLGNKSAGGIDPLQQAMNWSAALSAAPGAGATAHRGLVDMDVGTRMEILRTGKVPQWMKDSGITKGMVSSYVNNQTSTDLARFVEDKPTAIGAAVGRFRGAGGLGYLKGMSAKDRNAEIGRLGRAYAMTTGSKMDDAQGMFQSMAAELGLLPRARGHGAHRSDSMKSTYGVAAATQGSVHVTEADERGDQHEQIKGDIEDAPKSAKEQERMRKAAQAAGGGSPEDAIQGVQAALEQFVQSLRGVTNLDLPRGPWRAGPNGKPR